MHRIRCEGDMQRGFSRAVTDMIIATLIRWLIWHKASGQYRVDGRTKASELPTLSASHGAP